MATKVGRGPTLDELVEAFFNKDARTIAKFTVGGLKRTAEYYHAEDQARRAHNDLVRRELLEIFKRLGQPPTRNARPSESEADARPRSSYSTGDGGLLDELNQQHQRIREERDATRRRREIVREQLDLERERQHLEAEEAALRDLREGKPARVSADDLPPPPSARGAHEVVPPVNTGSTTVHPDDEDPPECAPLFAEALNIIIDANKRGLEDPEAALVSYEEANVRLRKCTADVPAHEAAIRDFHAGVLFDAIEACTQLKLISRWRDYLDELIRVSTLALESEFTPERDITYARALLARGDYALATDNLEEAESIFIAAQKRVRAVAPEGDDSTQIAMATLVQLGRRLDAIEARRNGDLH